MSSRNRSSIIGGVILILIGAWFLLVQFFPSIDFIDSLGLSWPAWVVGVGVFLLLMGLVFNAPGMAVPACIVGGIGCLLWYQNATGNWETWAYAWSLIPGFVGVGVILSGLLEGKFRSALSGGGWLIMISLVMFLVFGSVFGAGLLGDYWPLILIFFGLWILIQPLLRRK